MNVSIDGMRKNMVLDSDKLKDAISRVLENNGAVVIGASDLKDAFDSTVSNIKIFLCCYDDSNDGFNDLSNTEIDSFTGKFKS